jgi:hypothetical protein
MILLEDQLAHKKLLSKHLPIQLHGLLQLASHQLNILSLLVVAVEEELMVAQVVLVDLEQELVIL